MSDAMVQGKTIWRVRIAHSHTLKDGWRLSETTVEGYGTDIEYNEATRHLEEAHLAGEEEAKRRRDLEEAGGSK